MFSYEFHAVYDNQYSRCNVIPYEFLVAFTRTAQLKEA